MREDQKGTTEGEPIFDSLIWQPRLALLSRSPCPDKARPNVRSRRLAVLLSRPECGKALRSGTLATQAICTGAGTYACVCA